MAEYKDTWRFEIYKNNEVRVGKTRPQITGYFLICKSFLLFKENCSEPFSDLNSTI